MGLTVSLLSNKVFSKEQLYLFLTRGEFSIASIIDKTLRKKYLFLAPFNFRECICPIPADQVGKQNKDNSSFIFKHSILLFFLYY